MDSSQRKSWSREVAQKLLKRAIFLSDAYQNGAEDITPVDGLVLDAALLVMESIESTPQGDLPPRAHISEDGDVCLNWRTGKAELDIVIGTACNGDIDIQTIVSRMYELESLASNDGVVARPGFRCNGLKDASQKALAAFVEFRQVA